MQNSPLYLHIVQFHPRDDVSSHTSDPQRSGDSSNKSDEDVYDTADEEVQQTSAEKADKKLREEVIKFLECQRAHGPPATVFHTRCEDWKTNKDCHKQFTVSDCISNRIARYVKMILHRNVCFTLNCIQ